MSEDIGESLVGAYLRHVIGCEFLLFNTYLPSEQGEIDVIGIRLGPPRDIYFALVTTQDVRAKLLRAQHFAKAKFHGDQHHFQVWSPKVAKGAPTEEFATIAAEYAARDEGLRFMVNGAYGDAVKQLIAVARTSRPQATDQAFRLLQLLSVAQTSDGRRIV